MTAPIRRPATPEGIILWVMHRFSEVFGLRAVLKGGMALRFLDCPRSTTELDYVFAPFDSKRDITRDVEATLNELVDARIEVTLHSKMLRATVRLDDVQIQVEISVADECPSEPIASAGLARSLGQPSQVVRVMRPPHALAHKLAAWNERRLYRDLFDVHFLRTRAGALPDLATLSARLGRVESRQPALKKVRSMTLGDFTAALRLAADQLDEADLHAELDALLPPDETVGLTVRLRATLVAIADWIDATPAG